MCEEIDNSSFLLLLVAGGGYILKATAHEPDWFTIQTQSQLTS